MLCKSTKIESIESLIAFIIFQAFQFLIASLTGLNNFPKEQPHL